MGDLTGQVAVITGASQGIGWAIAETLASQGVHVVLNARGRERLEQRVAELKSKGYSVMGYVADVSVRQEKLTVSSRCNSGLRKD